MEPILLNFRETEFIRAKADLHKAKRLVQDFLKEMSTICSFEFDADAIQDLCGGSGEKTAAKLEAKVREELSRANITSSTVISLAVKGDLEKFYKLHNQRPNIPYEHYSKFEVKDDQQVYIKEGAEEALKEEYCFYIKTEKGKELYDKHVEMIKSMQELMALIPRMHQFGINDFIGYQLDRKSVTLPLKNYDELIKEIY